MAEDVLIHENSTNMVHIKKGKGKGKRSKLIEEGTDQIPLETIVDSTTSIKDQTKAKFDELLKQAIDQSHSSSGKKKKKEIRENEAMLASLKKGDGLRKDDDIAILANTYNPDDSPRGGKSKESKNSFPITGKDSLVIEDETKKASGVKKKKKKSVIESNLSQDIRNESKSQNKKDKPILLKSNESTSEPSLSVASTGKVKKKVIMNTDSNEVIGVMEDQRVLDGVESPRSLDDNSEETSTKEKRKKKKHEKQAPEVKEDIAGESTEDIPGQRIEDEGRILGITIHRTDALKNDFYIKHPLVRVHVVNETSGLYLQKQHADRSTSYFYEQENNKISYILPIMTQPFDFKKRKSTLPIWEEMIIFNENFNYFVSCDLRVIIFFELLDFVSMNVASQRHTGGAKQAGGWHRIAWAFLKPLGANDKVNVGFKVRLQLFFPPSRMLDQHGKVEVYKWWKDGHRRPYPSTLYVTLKSIQPPTKVQSSSRSMFATQQECGRQTFEDLTGSANLGAQPGTSSHEDGKKVTSWTRLAGQVCKIPNNHMLTLGAGRSGCYVLKFSHDGRYLACACHDRDAYIIYIYNIPGGGLEGEFSGHFGVIYDLCWSKSDQKLVSSSSDGTVRVWSMNQFGDKAERVLPHPSFVYAASFHPRVDTVIVSGGYDQVLRVWNIENTDVHGQLLQEIEKHHGHVNSLCFDDDGLKLYTADSLGMLISWNVFVSEMPSRRGFLRDWTLALVVDDPELRCVPINFIKMHPGGRRLLLHCCDNFVRMFDLRIHRVMQKYIGSMNFREKIRSTISPCGTFVISGSEDCVAYVWNTDTGDQVAMYEDLNYSQPITDVDYHPKDHIVAFSSLGDNQPVFVYNYNSHVAALGVCFPVVPKDEPGHVESTVSKPTVKGDLDLTETVRFERAMRKLGSVTAGTRPLGTVDLHPLGVPFSPKPQALSSFSTWGSTFDQTAFTSPRLMGSSPHALSPHAPTNINTIIQQQHFTSQGLYKKLSDGWRPSFGSVGRKGARSPPIIGRPPHITLNTSSGNAQFSFQAAPGKQTKYQEVIALYDYKAQRSDELTLLQGDAIKVLYKDNENWWMGELADGQQGFFPANYIVSQGEDEETHDNILHSYSASLDISQNIIGSKNSDKKVTTSAVNSKQGDLKFVSAPEESEEELLASSATSSKPRGSRDSHKSLGGEKRGVGDTST